jgi:hypothetical protein
VALGNVQGDLGRNDDAVISYQKAIDAGFRTTQKCIETWA